MKLRHKMKLLYRKWKHGVKPHPNYIISLLKRRMRQAEREMIKNLSTSIYN
jgi:hypothetical protein